MIHSNFNSSAPALFNSTVKNGSLPTTYIFIVTFVHPQNDSLFHLHLSISKLHSGVHLINMTCCHYRNTITTIRQISEASKETSASPSRGLRLLDHKMLKRVQTILSPAQDERVEKTINASYTGEAVVSLRFLGH